MPIYALKHYRPEEANSGDRVWLLEREVAFDAPEDGDAIMIAKKWRLTGFEPLRDLAILIDPDGKRIWECDLDA